MVSQELEDGLIASLDFVFPSKGKEGDGWVVQTVTAGSSQPDTILTRNLVLSAGLSCVNLLNPLLPAHERLTAYYSKGESKRKFFKRGPQLSLIHALTQGHISLTRVLE
jgi:hypothetical protein